MAIVRYHPSANLVNEIRNSMNWLLDPGCSESNIEKNSSWQPKVDIKEEESRYIIFADIPGVKIEDIKISLENNVLSIQGERNSEDSQIENGYYRVERHSGKFHRPFVLPKNADCSDIQATSKDGVLEISIPKSTTSPVRYIEVKQ